MQTNRPIIVCVCVLNNPSDNRWTTFATDGYDMVYVSNPNGLENDSKSSAWYDIDEVPHILPKYCI